MKKYITSRDTTTGEELEISFKDYGSGKPIVLIHGWPMSKDMWEYQLEDLVNAGLRVIKYDRRGFGKSDKPWSGYDYDALAGDLNALMEELDLNDVTLVGFSMGGGEVARYMSRYGANGRVSQVVFISSVTPYLLKTDDNPQGVDGEVFTGMMEAMSKDRIGFLDSFGKDFFGISMLNHPVSAPLLDFYRNMASVAAPQSTKACAAAFAYTDFRSDVQGINVPTLIIHGDSDKTVPIEASAERLAKMIPQAQFLIYEGAPHGLFYTHREALNRDLVSFATTGKSLPLCAFRRRRSQNE